MTSLHVSGKEESSGLSKLNMHCADFCQMEEIERQREMVRDKVSHIALPDNVPVLLSMTSTLLESITSKENSLYASKLNHLVQCQIY